MFVQAFLVSIGCRRYLEPMKRRLDGSCSSNWTWTSSGRGPESKHQRFIVTWSNPLIGSLSPGSNSMTVTNADQVVWNSSDTPSWWVSIQLAIGDLKLSRPSGFSNSYYRWLFGRVMALSQSFFWSLVESLRFKASFPNKISLTCEEINYKKINI